MRGTAPPPPRGRSPATARLLAGRLSDRFGTRRLAVGGAVAARLGALALTQLGPDVGDSAPVLASLIIGIGLAFVGPPTMGSLYRTLPDDRTSQGSSLLYMSTC